MAYQKYKDNPHRREPQGGRDHIQHIENGLLSLDAPTGTTVFNADGSITHLPTFGVPSTTVFNADGSIDTIAGGRTIRTTFNPDGSITEASV